LRTSPAGRFQAALRSDAVPLKDGGYRVDFPARLLPLAARDFRQLGFPLSNTDAWGPRLIPTRFAETIKKYGVRWTPGNWGQPRPVRDNNGRPVEPM
jgi:hypothetical protein